MQSDFTIGLPCEICLLKNLFRSHYCITLSDVNKSQTCSSLTFLYAHLVYFISHTSTGSFLTTDNCLIKRKICGRFRVCSLLAPDESFACLPGEQEPSAAVLPHAVSSGASPPLDSGATVSESVLWREGPTKWELWQTRKGLSELSSNIIRVGSYLIFLSSECLFFFQDKHWLLRQAVNPMTASSLTFLDNGYRKRYDC